VFFLFKHIEELGYNNARVRLDRYTLERDESRIIKDPVFLEYRVGEVVQFNDFKKENPNLVWYCIEDNKKIIDFDQEQDRMMLAGKWNLGEIQKIVLALLVKEMQKQDMFLFHGSAVRYNGKNILFMTGENNHGKTMTLIESALRGAEIIAGEGLVINNEQEVVTGSHDVFLRKRVKGTERADIAESQTGWKIFFEHLPPQFERVKGKIGRIDLIILPSIDGNFDTKVTKLGQFESEYQTFSCLSQSYFLAHQILASGIPMPNIDTKELRLKRSAFCTDCFCKIPYYLIMAKSPQILFDQVEVILKEKK